MTSEELYFRLLSRSFLEIRFYIAEENLERARMICQLMHNSPASASRDLSKRSDIDYDRIIAELTETAKDLGMLNWVMAAQEA